MEKEVKRGYVKWTDEDGVYHKEPLVDHPELLKAASPKEQLAAEEVRRLNEAAEESEKPDEDAEILETLDELKKAPDEVLVAADLDETESEPSNEPLDPKLQELREKTS